MNSIIVIIRVENKGNGNDNNLVNKDREYED